jgi:hypothetical protein
MTIGGICKIWKPPVKEVEVLVGEDAPHSMKGAYQSKTVSSSAATF